MIHSTLKCFAAALAGLTLSLAPATAQLVLNFDMSTVGVGGSSGVPVTATTVLDDNLTLTQGLQLGAGIELLGNGQVAEQISTAGYLVPGSLAEAITANDYMTFSVTVAPASMLDLNAISFDIRRNGGGAAKQYAILSSLGDGFVSTAALGTLNTTSTAIETITANTSAMTGFDTIAGGTTIEFRLYGWDATSNVANTHIAGASLAGEVPEPSTYALLAGCAGLILAALRRKKI